MIRLWKQSVIVAAMAGCYIYSLDINPYQLDESAHNLSSNEIVYRSYDGDYDNQQIDAETVRAYNNARIIVARTTSGRQVGMIRFGVSRIAAPGYPRTPCELISLHVDEQYRNQGIGRELMRLMLEKLKHTCESVEWISTPSAEPFYLKLGALPCHDEVHMRMCMAPSDLIAKRNNQSRDL